MDHIKTFQTIEQQIDLALKTKPEHPFAVFDADQTLWKSDIEHSLIAFLEMQNLLDIEYFTKIFPNFSPEQTSLSYFVNKIMRNAPKSEFGWMRKVLSGFSYLEIETQIEKLFSFDKTIELKDFSILPPKIHPFQVDLIRMLQKKHISIYVVTASVEDLVKIAVNQNQKSLPINSNNVFGLETEFRHSDSKKIIAPTSDKSNQILMVNKSSEEKEKWIFTDTCRGINTWHEGKAETVRSYISSKNRPLLVAGDSMSDFPMQKMTDPLGIKLFIQRNEKMNQKRIEAIEEQSKDQNDLRENWVICHF